MSPARQALRHGLPGGDRPGAALLQPAVPTRVLMHRVLLHMALLVAALVPAARAAEPGAETQIKAAFLVRMLGYLSWPPEAFGSASDPLRLGVVGHDALADELTRSLGERQPADRRVSVQRLATPAAAQAALPELHLVFIGRVEAGSLATLAARARGRPLLLVAEHDGALAAGATIAFIVVDDKVRFDIAPAAAEQAGVKVSARLLAVARRVLP